MNHYYNGMLKIGIKIPIELMEKNFPNRKDYKKTWKNPLLYTIKYYMLEDNTFVEIKKINWWIVLLFIPFTIPATIIWQGLSIIPELSEDIKRSFKPNRIEEMSEYTNKKGFEVITEYLREQNKLKIIKDIRNAQIEKQKVSNIKKVK